MEAYEVAHPEKNKSTAETAVEKVWNKIKTDLPAAYEQGAKVRR